MAIAFVLLLAGGAMAITGLTGRRRGQGPQTSLGNDVDIVRLRLALDWRAGDALRPALAGLAQRATGSPTARAKAVRRALDVLEEHRLSWLFAEVDDHRPMESSAAAATLQSLRDELATAHQDLDALARTAPVGEGYRALGAHAEGVVVVTLVVASNSAIIDADTSDLRGVERVIGTLRRHTASELVALELDVTPSAERARIPTDSLLASNPRMQRLEGIRGRAHCASCTAPYEETRERCPHCAEPRAA